MKKLSIGAVALALAFSLCSPASLAAPGLDSTDALASVDRNRNAIISDIAKGFERQMSPEELSDLKVRLAGLRADKLLAASLVAGYGSVRAILDASEAAAPVASQALSKAFGDTTRDLVYNPITPCRLVDTRGFGAPIAGGSFSPGARRTMIPAGACAIPGSGIVSMMLSFTTQNLTPSSGGYIAIVAPAAPVNTTVDIFNFNSEWSASITVTAAGTAGQFDVFVQGATAHVVVDVLGYFSPPSAGAVGTVYIADSAVTTAKLADTSVSNAKLAAGAVTTTKLADASVTGAKIDPATTITAAAFAYSSPVTTNLFVPPHRCQRSGTTINPYQDVVIFHSPANFLSPSLGAASGTGITVNCPIVLPVPAGTAVTIVGVNAYFIDASADCRLQMDLATRPLPGNSSRTVVSTLHSGSGAADFAYVSPSFSALEERAFPALSPIILNPALHVQVEATIARQTASTSECRVGGVKVTYTVDRA